MNNETPELQQFRFQVCAMKGRHKSAKWSEDEMRLLRSVFETGPTQEDILLLQRFYASLTPNGRRDMKSILTQWNSTLDHAKTLTLPPLSTSKRRHKKVSAE